jgi:hypothetical protein
VPRACSSASSARCPGPRSSRRTARSINRDGALPAARSRLETARAAASPAVPRGHTAQAGAAHVDDSTQRALCWPVVALLALRGLRPRRRHRARQTGTTRAQARRHTAAEQQGRRRQDLIGELLRARQQRPSQPGTESDGCPPGLAERMRSKRSRCSLAGVEHGRRALLPKRAAGAAADRGDARNLFFGGAVVTVVFSSHSF